MWGKVAEELQVPWRAAEAMHWKLGESEIARRTGATPFSLTAGGQTETTKTPMPRAPIQHPHPHPHPHPHAQDGMARELYRSPSSGYDQIPHGMPITLIPRRESLPPPSKSGPSRPQSTRSVQTMSISAPPTASATPPPPAAQQPEVNYELSRGLAPIHSQPQPRNPGALPSISELTTGLQLRREMESSGRPEVLYSSVKWTDPVGPLSHMDQQYHQQQQQQQHLQQQQYDSPRSKRRASPDGMTRESLQRRRKT